MDVRLQGRAALVTGAGRGIGRSIAMALAREGVGVALVARTVPELEEVAHTITRAGGRAVAIPADVTIPEQIESSHKTARKALGAIDILVNNAGNNQISPLLEMPPGDWWRIVELNLRAPYLYCRSVLPSMMEKQWGRIVNVASAAAKVGGMYVSAYTAAKAGLIGLTRAIALEVATTGVTVNAVCPGWVKTTLTHGTLNERARLLGRDVEQIERSFTERIPQRHMMDPDEIAPAVLFLCSEGAARTTGEALNVSAGLVMV